MRSFQIKDIKNFMAALLTTDTFDSFLLAEAVIKTYNTFLIDGHLVKDFFQSADENLSFLEKNEFSKWKDMRALCFQLIKGKKTPVSFRFIFHLDSEAILDFIETGFSDLPVEQLKAFILNIKYENGQLSLITATSYHTFSLDKSADSLWDSAIDQFLIKHGILYHEEL